eukprot:364443-Chlamydomonas_euryale.AAC.19
MTHRKYAVAADPHARGLPPLGDSLCKKFMLCTTLCTGGTSAALLLLLLVCTATEVILSCIATKSIPPIGQSNSHENKLRAGKQQEVVHMRNTI